MSRENQKYSFIIAEDDVRKATEIRGKIREYYGEQIEHITSLREGEDIGKYIDEAYEESLPVLILSVSNKPATKEALSNALLDIKDGMVCYIPSVLFLYGEEDFDREKSEIENLLGEYEISNWRIYNYSDSFLKLDEIQEELLTGEDMEIGKIYSDEIEEFPLS